MKSPVALILFNRPDFTRKVFHRIAESKPKKLFLIADGPREGNSDDIKKCEETRKVVENINWECDVYRNYSDTNLGCGIRPATGISWVFQHVDRAIILEDDCLPDLSFFKFCNEILEKYKDDNRVMQINGDNFQLGEKRTKYSYYFSKYTLTWGWATWRRAWEYYDYQIKLWEEFQDTDFPLGITQNEGASTYWRHQFNKAFQSESVSFWDYQWTFSFWVQNGLSISPNETLVSNIGFGENATHTKSKSNPYAYRPLGKMEFPLNHPPYMMANKEADDFIAHQVSKQLRFINNNNHSLLKKAAKKVLNKLGLR
ncbi:hypothetical protein NC796_03740 [Aliifodinibius sp. S!AR15-10]|uniref:hypothetical protein n=1 Tax=Aliifodinibius sp. S!AR15-10 TaxID=2950437 RepID=UPI00285EA27D|nr:hypothetical protein [Aliifodinibius sp. S!AR15-10]MDR8390239.1 hypothetical protein [Aliifodinibius sp. S!AR15-10]